MELVTFNTLLHVCSVKDESCDHSYITQAYNPCREVKGLFWNIVTALLCRGCCDMVDFLKGTYEGRKNLRNLLDRKITKQKTKHLGYQAIECIKLFIFVLNSDHHAVKVHVPVRTPIAQSKRI